MPLAPLPATFSSTRIAARRIGAHVMSRTRNEAVGRIDLASFSGGIGTPSFGPDHRVIRFSGGLFIVERTGDEATTRSINVNGSTLAQLAEMAGADLSTELDVGADTPELGDVDAPIEFDGASMTQIATWYAMGAQIIDRVVGALPASAAPTRARIWPEHFDLAIDVASGSGVRLNLGASPGDDFHSSPYLYVSPWDAVRPGDAAYWNAPFGAFLGYDDVAHAASAFVAGIEFMTEGLARLA
jgi:hypothetical protein